MPIAYHLHDKLGLLSRHIEACRLAADTCAQLLEDIYRDPAYKVEDHEVLIQTILPPGQRSIRAADPAPASRQLKAPRAKREKISITAARQNSVRMKQELAAYLDKHKNHVTAVEFFKTLQAHGMNDVKKGSVHTLFYTLKGKKLMKSNGDGSYSVNDSQKEKIRGQAEEEQEKAAAAVA
jgi:uncharacterized protein YjhX (UPF0386 family)